MASVKNDHAKEIERVRVMHPVYQEKVDDWKFYLAAYEGGSSFCNSGNIFKHIRENIDDYHERCRRIHNMNYCEELVEFFTSFIYNEPIQRDGGSNSDFYNQFLEDVTLRKEDITKFMPRVCNELQVFGTVYALVDSPDTSFTQVLTKADEKAFNIRPYWILVSPIEVLDWDKDSFDQFTYFKRRVFKTQRVSGERRNYEVYTEYYTDKIIISTIDVTEQEPEWLGEKTLPNTLGIIPVAVAYYKRSRQLDTGVSFLVDLSMNQREILNLTSVLQEFLYKQAFSILAKEVDSNVPLNSQEADTIGVSNVMEVPKDAEFPQYITPSEKPAQFLQSEIERIKREMYLRAAQEASNEVSGGQQSSGFSQAQSFFKTVPFITRRADILEGFEMDLMKLTMLFMGKTWDGKIKYKDRYEITAFTDAVTQLLTLTKDLALPSKTFIIAQFKRLVKEYDPKMLAEDVQAIDRELDQLDFAKWQFDLLEKKEQSAGAQQKLKSTGTMAENKAESTKKNSTPAATNKLKGK